MNIIGSALLLVIFLITLISTFTFLQNKNLNLIPLFSLFIVSISIIILVVNVIRYKVIKKIKAGEYQIDESFLKLYILKKYFEQHNIFERIKNEQIKASSLVNCAATDKERDKEYQTKSETNKENNNNSNNSNTSNGKYSDFIIETDISSYILQKEKLSKNKFED